jgi:hypothetical protein
MYRYPPTAYFFDKIEKSNGIIDLNFYSDSSEEKNSAVRFMLGKSNIFAKRCKNRKSIGMSNPKRNVVAVLRLKKPYVVWIKS